MEAPDQGSLHPSYRVIYTSFKINELLTLSGECVITTQNCLILR